MVPVDRMKQKLFSDHDKTSPSIAAVSAPSILVLSVYVSVSVCLSVYVSVWVSVSVYLFKSGKLCTLQTEYFSYIYSMFCVCVFFTLSTHLSGCLCMYVCLSVCLELELDSTLTSVAIKRCL